MVSGFYKSGYGHFQYSGKQTTLSISRRTVWRKRQFLYKDEYCLLRSWLEAALKCLAKGIRNYEEWHIMSDIMEFANKEEFRKWLYDNCLSSAGIWLLFGKARGPKTIKASGFRKIKN